MDCSSHPLPSSLSPNFRKRIGAANGAHSPARVFLFFALCTAEERKPAFVWTQVPGKAPPPYAVVGLCGRGARGRRVEILYALPTRQDTEPPPTSLTARSENERHSGRRRSP